MAFISWCKDYEIGVWQVDAEHRKLFDLVNDYYNKHIQGNNRKEIERVLNALVAYAEEHFQNEEALMLADQFRAGTLGIGELFAFLAKDVVAKHMLSADREFSPYLAQ